MAGKYRLVDAMTGMPSRPRPQAQARKLDPNIARWFKPSREMSEGATLDDMVAAMDAGDVEFAHVTAAIMGRVASPTYGVGQDIPDALFDALCRRASELMQRGPIQSQYRTGPDARDARGAAA